VREGNHLSNIPQISVRKITKSIAEWIKLGKLSCSIQRFIRKGGVQEHRTSHFRNTNSQITGWITLKKTDADNR
jgi:hypothetical protein